MLFHERLLQPHLEIKPYRNRLKAADEEDCLEIALLVVCMTHRVAMPPKYEWSFIELFVHHALIRCMCSSEMASLGSILGDRFGVTTQSTLLASAAAVAATLLVVRCFSDLSLLGKCWFVGGVLGRQHVIRQPNSVEALVWKSVSPCVGPVV